VSTLKQRREMQAYISVSRDLLMKVDLALSDGYDTARERRMLYQSRAALRQAQDCILVALVEVGEALTVLDEKEKHAEAVDGAATGAALVPEQKVRSNKVSRRSARAR
jgi:hypothetical protein